MRHQFLLASVGAIALAGSAFAADLPMAPPPPPVPIFSWTGLYLGLQVGYAWDHDSENFGFGPTFLAPVPFFISSAFSTSPSGVIGGAHIGYNLQINQWVAGVEGSIGWHQPSAKPFSTPLAGATWAPGRPIQGSIRARAGVAWDRALIYVTGGAAFTGITNGYSNFGIGLFSIENISKTRAGWTVGGGIEYAVTNNWSVRAEYRYSDFGHYTDFPFASTVFPGSSLRPAPSDRKSGASWRQL